ncbi:MAG: hypothetical protein LBL04_15500 [Bacteroidales bacterium]|jgi:hypothetical protein|nr:hypothetical protein [Bacteroidales bacterium]
MASETENDEAATLLKLTVNLNQELTNAPGNDPHQQAVFLQKKRAKKLQVHFFFRHLPTVLQSIIQ